jgi:hypothetical protein
MTTSQETGGSEGTSGSEIAPILDPSWPVDDSKPSARPDISTVPLDDNVAIYDEVGQVLVMLNPSASAVLERCDGVMPFSAIVAELAEDHGEQIDIVRQDAWRTVRKLASMGLVAEAP